MLRSPSAPPQGGATLPASAALRLRTGRAGPAIDLTVFLSARPDPASGTFGSVVESGVLWLSVAAAAGGAERLDLTLRSGARIIGSATAGGVLDAGLRTVLNRTDTLAVLAALEPGEPAVAATPVMVRLEAGSRRWEASLRMLASDESAVELCCYYPDPARPAHFRKLEPLVQGLGTRSSSSRPAPLHMVSRGFPTPVSRTLALVADRTIKPSAHALLASSAVHHLGIGAFAAHDLVVDPPQGATIESLPIVTDVSAPLWSDRAGPRRFYGPGLSLTLPKPADPLDTSAFAFEMTRLGVTTDPSLPALAATVRFTLDIAMSDATRDALAAAGSPEAVAVPLGNLSARLEVPVRDVVTQELKFQPFVATTELSGSVLTVTVELQGDFVRLLYGALAYPDFQSEPARLKVAYAFPAYVPVSDTPIRLAFIDKLAIVPLLAERRELPQEYRGPVLDPRTATIRQGAAASVLARETAASRSPKPMLAAVHAFSPAVAASVAPSAPATLAASSVLVAHPQLALSAIALATLAEPKYAVQTLVREVSVDVLLPCATYGPLYVETKGPVQEPIGCRDVLALGQLDYRLYEELTAFRAPTYRVFRALQQPGRFMLLPATYRMARYAATEPADRRFRPTALIYALVGDTPTGSTYWFTATLEPDIPEYVRARLLLDLVPLSPIGVSPAIDYPTDPAVNATITWNWAVPSGTNTPDAESLWNSIQVAVSTGLQEAVVLKEVIEHSGLRGSVAFKLPDGTPPLASQLVVDTTTTGPWIGGPVPAAVEAGGVRIRNAIEQPVNVTAVHVLRAGVMERMPLPLTLPVAGEHLLEAGGKVDAAYVEVAPMPPVTLAELGVFEEDVATNVHFINQCSLSAHQLKALAVRARVTGTTREFEAPLPDLATATLDLVFPLTTYLEGQSVDFRLTATPTTGPDRQGPWKTWDLVTAGNVIGVTADLLP